MTARWYSPDTGRFTGRDDWTLDPKPSIAANRFTYGNGDPVGTTDPSGHCGVPCGLWNLANELAEFVNGTPTASGCDDQIYLYPGGPMCPYWQWKKDKENWEKNCGGSRSVYCTPDSWSPCAEAPGRCGPRPPSAVGGGGGGGPKSPKPPKVHGPAFQPPPPPLWLVNALTPLAGAAAGTFVTLERAAETAAVNAATKVIDRTVELVDKNTKITKDPDPLPLPLPAPVEWPNRDDDEEESCLEGKGVPGPPANPNNARYGPVVDNHATWADACLVVTRKSERRKPHTPDGFDSQDIYANARAHLIAYTFYGSNGPENIVAFNQNIGNNSEMYHRVERVIEVHVTAGERVYFQVVPIFDDDDPVPDAFVVHAQGNKGFSCNAPLPNIAVKDPDYVGCGP